MKLPAAALAPPPGNPSEGWARTFTAPGVIDGPVYALATDGVNVYVGGSFSVAGDIVANNVAKWDGQRWSSVGTGSENGVNVSVQTLAWVDGKLFVGGGLTRAGSVRANSVAYWDGARWNALGRDSTNGVTTVSVFGTDTLVHAGYVYGLYGDGETVYIGGQFHRAGGQQSVGVAGWNTRSGAWERFNGGLASRFPSGWAWAFAFARSGDDLYVGGSFDTAGSVVSRSLARWDGSAFHPVGGGVNNWIREMVFDGSGSLLVAGNFDSAGTIRVPGIARWTGESWLSIGAGEIGFDSLGSSYVKSMALVGDRLFAAGRIVMPGRSTVAGTAEWDGGAWRPIGGLEYAHGQWPGGLHKLLRVGDRIYGGGDFVFADGTPANHIAEWVPAEGRWKPLHDGSGHMGVYDGTVLALATSADGIIAGGNFMVAGGVRANNIARWNGSRWEPLGDGAENGITGTVYAILADGQDIYVGGHFGWAGTSQAYHIARWDGSRWTPLGIGVGGVPGASVNALALKDGYLYAGGRFSLVADLVNGVVPANSIARYDLRTGLWEAVDFGVELAYQIPGFVHAIHVDGKELYIGGRFNYAGDRPARNLAMLKSGTWTVVGIPDDDGVDGEVFTLVNLGGDLVVGGLFERSGTGNTASLARWDGREWTEFSGGLSKGPGGPAYVMAAREHEKKLYIAGHFRQAGRTDVSHVAMWDGSEWSDIAGGVNAPVFDALVHNGVFYAGGMFTTAGGRPSVAFAAYDATVTGVPDDISRPTGFVLHPNYPNPFNPSTSVRFSLPEPSRVRLSVYDMLGRQVERIADGEFSAGDHAATWTPHGSTGVYLLRMEAEPVSGTGGRRVHVRKMSYVR